MIIRRERNSNYTIVPNEPINDRTIGAEALGLLVYLLSRPDDWVVHVAQLRGRFGFGKDKMQSVMRHLIQHRYVTRRQVRETSSSRFLQFEYVVYDEPQQTGRPGPENPATEFIREIEPQPCLPAPEKPEPEKPAVLLSTERYQYPYGENSASSEAGADAPLTLNAQIWKEGTSLLETRGLPASRPRAVIGKWCKRATSKEKKGKLLAAIRAAARAGTGDPVAYIEAAIKVELPSPPNPKEFTPERWALNAESAIKFRQWAPEWGPRPGKPGCLMPKELQSPQLMAAIAGQKQAA